MGGKKGAFRTSRVILVCFLLKTIIWAWLNIKELGQTSGSLWFHLPRCHFRYIWLSHSHLASNLRRRHFCAMCLPKVYSLPSGRRRVRLNGVVATPSPKGLTKFKFNHSTNSPNTIGKEGMTPIIPRFILNTLGHSLQRTSKNSIQAILFDQIRDSPLQAAGARQRAPQSLMQPAKRASDGIQPVQLGYPRPLVCERETKRTTAMLRPLGD